MEADLDEKVRKAKQAWRDQQADERAPRRVVLVDVRLPFWTVVRLAFNVFVAVGLVYWAIRLYGWLVDEQDLRNAARKVPLYVDTLPTEAKR